MNEQADFLITVLSRLDLTTEFDLDWGKDKAFRCHDDGRTKSCGEAPSEKEAVISYLKGIHDISAHKPKLATLDKDALNDINRQTWSDLETFRDAGDGQGSAAIDPGDGPIECARLLHDVPEPGETGQA